MYKCQLNMIGERTKKKLMKTMPRAGEFVTGGKRGKNTTVAKRD